MKIYIDKGHSCGVNYQISQYIVELCDYLTEDIDEADIIIIPNSCCCSEMMLTSTLSRINNIYEEHPTVPIYVTGCITRQFKDNYISMFINDFFVKRNINVVPATDPSQILEAILKDKYDHSRDEFGFGVGTKNNEADLYISTGCLNNCTFCKSSYQKLTLKSARLEVLKKELRKLASEGKNTITIKGTNTAQYGYDLYGKCRLPELLEYIENTRDIERVNLSGLAFKDVLVNDLLPSLISSKKVKYINGSLESGSNRLLKMMNKGFTKEQISTLLESLSDRELGICIISGFPTETKQDIKDTIDVLKVIKKGFVMINPYVNSSMVESSHYEQLSQKEINKHTKLYKRALSLRKIKYYIN